MNIPDFCQDLKEKRLQQGLALNDLEDRSNIPVKVLQTLEDGIISQIPGRFYLRSFIRSYLLALGIDEKDFFLKHHREISGHTHINDTEKVVCFSKLKYHRFRSKKFLYIITGIILLFLLLGILLLPAAAPIRDWLGMGKAIDRITLYNGDQKPVDHPMCFLMETL